MDVISWAGKNEVNGLVYGNGGIKCWPKDVVMNMRTHENALGDKRAPSRLLLEYTLMYK